MRSLVKKDTKQKLLCTILIAAIATSVFSMIWWYYGATNGFNRGLDLIAWVTMMYSIIPLAVVTFFSLLYAIYTVKDYKKCKKTASMVVVVVFALIMIPYSIFINTHPSLRQGPVRDFVRSDTIRPTDDGLFEYRLDLINLFQGNARARLFVRDLTTGEEVYIPLMLPLWEVGGILIPGGNANFLWARMRQGEQEGQYILRIPAGKPLRRIVIDRRVFEFTRIGDIQATFLIDIPNATATRIE